MMTDLVTTSKEGKKERQMGSSSQGDSEKEVLDLLLVFVLMGHNNNTNTYAVEANPLVSCTLELSRIWAIKKVKICPHSLTAFLY